MAMLKHEVWKDADGLPTCCLAGPDGAGARALVGDGARLVWTFEAACHFEAMSKYNELLGRGPYTTDQPSDYEPYPEDWRRRQG